MKWPNTTMDNPLRCFAAPQYFLKRFALRLWQLNCRFAASPAPKLKYFSLTNASWKYRQLAMVGLCVGWKVYKAGWKVCCWKVCWWQLAMAGLCVGLSGSLSWVAWHMYSVVQHVPHNSYTISMLLHHDALTCFFRLLGIPEKSNMPRF